MLADKSFGSENDLEVAIGQMRVVTSGAHIDGRGARAITKGSLFR